MRINRVDLLGRLQQVQAGIATRESIEQSGCFVFTEEHIVTFNDEVCCRVPNPCPAVLGAVVAKPLLDVLSKMAEEELDIGADGGQLVLSHRDKQAKINMEAQILLPVDRVELPAHWVSLSPDFGAAVELCSQCVSTDPEKFILNCIHVHPHWIESCDNCQIARYPCATGVQHSTTIRSVALKAIVGLGMVQSCETKNWLHFQNPNGLIVSCRRYKDPYPDLSHLVDNTEGSPAVLPPGLAEAVDKANIFSSDNESNTVQVELAADKLLLVGQGSHGMYRERKKISYSGQPLRFIIAPKILTSVVQRHNACTIRQGALRVDTGKFVYITCLGEPKGA